MKNNKHGKSHELFNPLSFEHLGIKPPAVAKPDPARKLRAHTKPASKVPGPTESIAVEATRHVELEREGTKRSTPRRVDHTKRVPQPERGLLAADEKSPAGVDPSVFHPRPLPSGTPGRALSKPPMPRAGAVAVVVGLDFGTSLTKVAYRVLGGSSNEVRPVLFACAEKGGRPWSVPSLASWENGVLQVGHAALAALHGQPWRTGLRMLKMLLAGTYARCFRHEPHHRAYPQDAPRIEVVCAILLAHVMAESTHILEREIQRPIEPIYLCCMPIKYRENPAVRSAFERVLELARHLAEQRTEEIRAQRFGAIISEGENLWKDIRYPLATEDTNVFFAEESGAQVASFYESQGEHAGIHALLDFGAGTTDLSIFYHSQDSHGLIRRALLGSTSLPVGSVQMEDEVVSYLVATGVATPEAVERSLRDRRSGFACRLHSLTREIFRQTEDVWGEAFGKLQEWSNCGESLWNRRMTDNPPQVFVCGGGALNPFVAEVFGRCWYRDDWGPYSVNVLPRPHANRYSDQSHADAPFHRMAAAYGLASQSFAQDVDRPDVNRRIQRLAGIEPPPSDD